MVNIKTKINILGISAALILCGCNNSEIAQPDLNTDVTSSPITVSISQTEETAKPSETENTAETAATTEAEQATEADQTE